MAGKGHPLSGLNVGAVVDYHAVIDGPVTEAGMVVRHKPFKDCGGKPVVLLRGKAGYVSLDAVTLPEGKSSDGDADRTV